MCPQLLQYVCSNRHHRHLRNTPVHMTDIPKMGGHSTGVMKLLRIVPLNTVMSRDESSSPGMKNVTLELETVSL